MAYQKIHFLCNTVQYMKVDDIIDAIMRLGRGTMVAKFDVQSAYRVVPIHPDDRHFLGMEWKNQFYVDMVLPFGLTSAPYIFASIADLVEWILKQNYIYGQLSGQLQISYVISSSEVHRQTHCLSTWTAVH